MKREKQEYTTLEVDVLEVALEQGFAVSLEGSTIMNANVNSYL